MERKQRRGAYRRYTVEEKRKAVERAGEVGVRKAAAELGIPHGTLGHWVERASKEREQGAGASTAAVRREPQDAVEPRGKAVEDGAGTPLGPAAKVARRYTPSEKARALEYAAEHGISAASKALGISRFAIHDWRRKLAAGDVVTTGSDPADEEDKRDREILAEWKKHPGLGPSQIHNQLRRRGIQVATNTVRRVMEDAGYRTPKVKRHEHDQRFESVRPNHMWHMDFVHRYINRASTFTLILIDDHSRFVTGFGVDDAERADMVLETFRRAVERHGRPEFVMHDRGSAFWSWRGISRFTRLLEEMGVDQIVARHKELNGKAEVFNKNLHKEFFDAQRFHDVGEMSRRLRAHVDWYNHRRTHHALGGLLVPADRYYGRVDEVIARIEAGAGADVDIHAVELRDRELELFRVVQNGGVPEVWLMGRKLLALG